MANNRHLGRIVVLQSLYEYEFRVAAGEEKIDMPSLIAKNIVPYSKTLGATKFVHQLAMGVFKNMQTLDETLQPLAPEWPINSIAAIDRNILRMGLYELTLGKDNGVPPKVAIDEAVELAKSFGSDNSSKFVNGVLGTVYKGIEKGEIKTDGAEKKTKTSSTKTSAATERKNSASAN